MALAMVDERILAVSETCLGRPGPRLVEGYRILREAIAGIGAAWTYRHRS
ncbi:MAG: hypothetical protein IT467_11105 [Dokdonella sp.]|nr:hypothetical protein [Dokdonella sp.]MBZ0223348.1 hypothetical protein [Dokdonella sp.]MCC7256463.1 hypothetical protein [Dokdonella sp.]